MEKYKFVYKIDRNKNHISSLGETFLKKIKFKVVLCVKIKNLN